MNDSLVKTVTTVAIVLILACSGVLLFKNFKSSSGETIIIHDTTTITRYETQLKRDTVIKWYERFTTIESKPKVIYQQKVDSVFIEKIKSYDLILGIDKKGTNLRVFALNQNSQLLKEQIFENVYDNFTAFSTTDKVVVKSQLFYWNGLRAGYEHTRPVNDLKTFSHSVNIMTGINFIDKFSLDVGPEYDMTNKEFKLKGRFTVRIF